MVRSLYSGISGLRTHQVGLDVTANNIANVNTIAFKAGRATFKESMVQMLQGSSRPAGNQGGRNPMQIGLGVAVGSIDTMLRQGNFQTTGQITDLALEGRAYFAFSSGSATYYSRNGGLQMDSQGYLVSPTNGFRLQGRSADVNGNYLPDSVIGDIRIPWGDKAPAKATDYVALSCNLNSDSSALGTVTHTNRFLASVGITDIRRDMFVTVADVDAPGGYRFTDDANALAARSRLTDLFDADGNSLGIKEGDILTFSVAETDVPAFKFAVEKPDFNPFDPEAPRDVPTLRDLVISLEAYLNGINDPAVTSAGTPEEKREAMRAHVDDYVSDFPAKLQTPLPAGVTGRGPITVDVDPTGGLVIRYPSTYIANPGDATPPPAGLATTEPSIVGLQIGSSRPGSNSFVRNAFLFPRSIDSQKPVWNPNGGALGSGAVTAAAPQYAALTPSIRIPADASDELQHLMDANGRSLGFSHGDEISINGMVGGKGITPLGFTFSNGSDGSDPTTMLHLMEYLQDAFHLPANDGTIYRRDSVSIKSSADLVNDGIPAGSIVLRGQTEAAFSLTGISVNAKGDPLNPISPTRFNSNMTFTAVQDARNTGVWTTSDVVYDDSGAEHHVVMTFTHTGTPGEWLWEMTTAGGDAIILGGNRGRVTFALDGTPSSFTFDDNSSAFRFDPRNGAAEVAIRLDAGEPGSRTGITQYHAESTTALTGQNGYPMGKLSEISISEDGEIVGVYTNHTNKSIAQIYVAEFNNPAGLSKMGDSMFAVSSNSGQAAMYRPMIGSTTKVKPGALEMSNVEMETEFTNMITIQRGYQASARVVSTSDQMLQELVQLVR